MKYKDMTDEQKERAFAEDVLGWELISQGIESTYDDGTPYLRIIRGIDMNVAMLGVEKILGGGFYSFRLDLCVHGFARAEFWTYSASEEKEATWVADTDTPNEAIVKACLRIVRPDLFEDTGDD